MENPFGTEPSRLNIVRFVSILSKADRGLASVPSAVPAYGEWFVRVIASKNRFVFGVYRRHMKTIGYLDQIDKTVRGAGDDTELDHNYRRRADFERPEQERQAPIDVFR
jgi:hypothetical protein